MSKVYFLGAGATKSDFPSAPLNNDLLKLKNFGDDPKNTEIKLFLDMFFNTKDSGNMPNPRDVLSFIDSCLQKNNIHIKGYGNNDFLHIKRLILSSMSVQIINTLDIKEKIGIRKYDVQDPFSNSKEIKLKTCHEKFVDIIKNGDVVISTNYDIAADVNLFKRLGINYGIKCRCLVDLTKDYTRNYIHLSRPLTIQNFHHVNCGKNKLLKLHGSLTWLYCPKCNEIDISVNANDVLDAIDEEKFCVNEKCTGVYEPILVTPTYLKNYINTFLNETWKMAEISIANSDEIIFIGYSLPSEDYEIKSLLLRSVNSNEKYPIVTVVDVDKKGVIENSYKSILNNVNYLDCGFEEYVNKILGQRIL